MAPPTIPKTPSKGSKKIVIKPAKGSLSASKSAAGGPKKAHRRKRKSQS
jgi:hypothetical protein